MFQKLEESSFSSSKCFFIAMKLMKITCFFAYYSVFAGLLFVIFVAVRDHCRPFLTYFVPASSPSDLLEVEMEVCYVKMLPIPKIVW